MHQPASLADKSGSASRHELRVAPLGLVPRVSIQANLGSTRTVNENQFESDWTRLNHELAALERGQGGLAAALMALRDHQLATGFIRDDASRIERYRLREPGDGSRFFSAQYNARRAIRLQGPPTAARAGTEVVHDGCMLCRRNVIWQQSGREIGYDLQTASRAHVAWMNPYPLLPLHTVIATRDHLPQASLALDGLSDPVDLQSLLSDLVGLASRLPGFLGFFNGVGAGASIFEHHHLQFFERHEKEALFPLEMAAERAGTAAGFVADYPIEVRFWRGEAETLVSGAASWIHRWSETHEVERSQLTGNLIAALPDKGGDVSLYYVPRRREAEGQSQTLGGLEVLGELVLSEDSQKQSLKRGDITFRYVEKILSKASVSFAGPATFDCELEHRAEK